MNNYIRNINEGDEDYTEGKERKIVNEKEENKKMLVTKNQVMLVL